MRVWWAVWVGPAELFVGSGCIGGAILWALASYRSYSWAWAIPARLFVGLGRVHKAIRWLIFVRSLRRKHL